MYISGVSVFRIDEIGLKHICLSIHEINFTEIKKNLLALLFSEQNILMLKINQI